jgi:DNA modification methylase
VIHIGDAIEVMAGMNADSVDAIVTDPPYGLEFMGKEWDNFKPALANRGGKAPGRSKRDDTKLAPVAYGIGGRRSTLVCDGCGKRDKFTNPHACPEDTGWTRIFLDDDPRHAAYGVSFQAWCEAWGREALRVTKPGGYLLAFGGTRTHHRLVCGLEDSGWIIRDELDWIYASGFPKGKANLKPAHEPIVMARKPGPLRLLAIDECRIGTDTERGGRYNGKAPLGSHGDVAWGPRTEAWEAPAGRWPSNLLLSDPALFDEPNPYVVGSGATSVGAEKPYAWSKHSGAASFATGLEESVAYGDVGGYARYFIVPKADRADREPVLRGQLTMSNGGTLEGGEYISEGRTAPKNGTTARENAHPTVKPTDLMRHLVRLVTPSGGTVLDCFLGSGSTALACELEGFPWIGIEKDPEYVKIAEARLNHTQRGFGL